MLKTVLCSVALAACAMSASAATTVDVDFTTAYSGSSGSFVATDSNDDGIIEEDEVTSFYTNLLGNTTSSLETFGDYDIATNTWSEIDGYNYTTTSSGTLLGASDAVTTVVAVPEPATLSMFAFGALALGFIARRRRVR